MTRAQMKLLFYPDECSFHLVIDPTLHHSDDRLYELLRMYASNATDMFEIRASLTKLNAYILEYHSARKH